MVRSFEVGSRGFEVGSRGLKQSLASASWIDNYDDQDYSEYSLDTASFGFDTSTVWEGTASAVTNFTPSDYVEILSTSGDGLDNYFAKGNISEIYVRSNTINASNTTRQEVAYANQGRNNAYRVQIEWEDDQIFLRVEDGGSFTDLDSTATGIGLSADTWIRVRITWDDGSLGGSDNDHTIEFEDTTDDSTITTLTANDSTHATADGVGIAARINTVESDDFWWDGWELNP